MKPRPTRRPTGPVLPVLPASPEPDSREVARFLRPQPRVPIPRRTWLVRPAGSVAYALLGGRVITRHSG